jgi:hypothetical protein
MGLEALQALQDAIERDDPALVQRATTHPSSNDCPYCEECVGGCAVSYGLWKSMGLHSIGDVERCFSKLCASVDAVLGPGSSTRWLNHFDELPREQMRAELLPEVIAAISRMRKDGEP